MPLPLAGTCPSNKDPTACPENQSRSCSVHAAYLTPTSQACLLDSLWGTHTLLLVSTDLAPRLPFFPAIMVREKKQNWLYMSPSASSGTCGSDLPSLPSRFPFLSVLTAQPANIFAILENLTKIPASSSPPLSLT